MPRGPSQPAFPAPAVQRRRPSSVGEPLSLKPLAQAIALLMLASSAQAAQPFSSAWFAAKGASSAPAAGTGATGTLPQPGSPPALAQQQRLNQQFQRSLSNLNDTVAAIAAQQAAQANGRTLAQVQPQVVPNGLGEGGLKVDDNPLTQGWRNAKAPQQTQAGGKTQVRIEQTADKAVLNWETFNVGRDTTLTFDQQAQWAVLNRVNDPSARPSQIQGQIEAAGTVMLVNRNGVVFSGSSQVNVRNLVAAAAQVSDEQFTQRGLYVDNSASQATFTQAGGKVLVERGAQIATREPASSTQGGGYVLLLGSEVHNDGTISTAKGQATLAAGDDFYIRRGQGTEANKYSTTRGNEVASSLRAGSSAGQVSNSGLIQASGGDITLTGHQVRQDGVLLASTSVDRRGSLHLLNSASDASGSVSFGRGSVSAVLLDASSALDSQREAALTQVNGVNGNQASGRFDNLGTLIDRPEQSRIEVVSGGTVHFQEGSLTLATGGQVAVSAGRRSLVDDGARLDVAGALGVKVAMESNNIKISVQGNEQRDAAGNRDRGGLINSDVWVDVRELVHVAAGVNGYASERWYTGGGLLEVGGYLGTRSHGIGEWMAQGGTLTFTGQDLVTRAGAEINLSGGTLAVQDGVIRQSWLRGADGRLYELSRAPGDLLYSGVYRGFEDSSVRWNQTRLFFNPLIAPQQRLEQGYTVGRDAGSLVVATQAALLEGRLVGQTWQDERQVQAPVSGLDGYQQVHTARARGAQLVVGQQVPTYLAASKTLAYSLSPVLREVQLRSGGGGEAAAVTPQGATEAARLGRLQLDTELLDSFALGGLTVAASEQVRVEGALHLADGGQLALHAAQVAVDADLVARGGSIRLGDVLPQLNGSELVDRALATPAGLRAQVQVARDVRLDVSGVRSDRFEAAARAWRNGGSLSLRSTGDVLLDSGSLLDVSAGVVRREGGRLLGGSGGDITLQTAFVGARGGVDGSSRLQLDGQLRGHGSSGAGTLDIRGARVQIGGARPADAGVYLGEDFFNLGFARYNLRGSERLEVAADSQVRVARPVQLLDSLQPLGEPLPWWLPPLLQEDAVKGVLGQRGGASLNLAAGDVLLDQGARESARLLVGRGATLEVDPLQSIALSSTASLTLEGSLLAHGGAVSLLQERPLSVRDGIAEAPHQRAIRLGDTALIDVGGRAYTARDAQGRRYGRVDDGGSIVIGGTLDHARGVSDAADLFVVVESGARLRADGSQALLDIRGQGPLALASAGGSISLASNNGLRLDGAFSAAAGGSGAAGGSLTVALDTGLYLNRALVDSLIAPRELLLEQQAGAVQDGPLRYGQARLAVERVQAGGFTRLSLLSDGVLAFAGDIDLSLAQDLRLYSGSLVLADSADANSRVRLSAPYVRLAGSTHDSLDLAKRPTVKGGQSLRDSQAQLQVEANLIELRDSLSLGAHGSLGLAGGQSLVFDRRGFALGRLRSDGDIRLLGSSNLKQSDRGRLSANADLELLAAQVYPVTGAFGALEAGKDATLRIGRSTVATPALPLSAFGRLQLLAGTVEQGGVVRAPLGQVMVGGDSGELRGGDVHQVRLLPGSITSVSGAGLTMPYGGTVDGLTYLYGGEAVKLLGGAGDSAHGVVLGGQQVDVQAGALVDLSGGGQLTGAGFVSGRGGSTDARYHPLAQLDADGRLLLPSLTSNPVYAIVPGLALDYAPLAGASGAADPAIGQQITLDHGIPGLAAGTYTLMPANYALLPGAFRVELNGVAAAGQQAGSQALRNGSWSTSASLSTRHTAVRQALPGQVILTAGEVLRRYSQYNETSYAAFVAADAAAKGVPRAAIEADGKGLTLALRAGANAADNLRVAGTVNFAAAKDGRPGHATVLGALMGIEVLADAAGDASGDPAVLALRASQLNALKAPRLVVGTRAEVTYGQGGNLVNFTGGSRNVWVRSGAELRAGEIWLSSNSTSGGVFVEQGAGLVTLGQGTVPFDASAGYLLAPGKRALLVVSNGRVDVQPPEAGDITSSPGTIILGECASGSCQGNTRLYSEGSLFAATDNSFSLGEQVSFGTRHLGLAVGRINVGSAQALASAAADGVLGRGLTLNQQVLDRLFRGDASTGVPGLETLTLSASDSLNFFGSSVLDTFDPLTGKNRLQDLILGVPAIYGQGHADDRAVIRTGSLIWNGARTPAGAPIAGGAGSGDGVLDIQVSDMVFGYGPASQPDGSADMARQTLGFAQVAIHASHQVSANHKGSLQVHHRRGDYQADGGFQYRGGDLLVDTPLWTGAAGSRNRVSAGGTLSVRGGGGALANGRDKLGAELLLEGQHLDLDGTFSLPSGKLTLEARDDLLLGEHARLDLAGRALAFNDVTRYSWGGELALRSQDGNIRQAAGARIDLSASQNRAGRLSAIALGEQGGRIELLGQILGAASGSYNAGGTLVPYAQAQVDIRAQQLDDFAALNQRLNRDQVFGARQFQIKQGDLVIGNELKAHAVAVSLDNGRLTVDGRIDASGEQVGSIRLAARQGLTVTGNGQLDAHGSVLRVDSDGAIIDAPNRASIELSSGEGLLSLAGGARFDLRHGTAAPAGSGPGQHDGRSLGSIQLIAPRLGGDTAGDIAIEARGPLQILGARSIAVVGNQQYRDAPDGGTSASGRPVQVIDQAYLDGKHLRSSQFIDNLLGNRELLDHRLAGLNNATYAKALHLRPGVEIASRDSATDLVVQGDLDLSAHRYASLNPGLQKTTSPGSGEVGNLTLRAGGNLEVYGSINDGFAPPDLASDEARMDGRGWLLLPGKQPFDSDLVIPRSGVELAEGTQYPAGSVLNFDLPFAEASLPANTRLPSAMSLAAPLQLPAGTVLEAAVRDSAGNLLHAAGTLLGQALTLPAGSRLDAGSRLPVAVTVQGGTWNKGVALPDGGLIQRGSLALALGSRLPAGTDVKLAAGVDLVELRPSLGGQQGRNWALAQMLPAGSESWSMRLVAGADLDAADSRLTRPQADAGLLRLADQHYIAGQVKTGGTGPLPGTGKVWAPDNGAGFPAGEPVAEDQLVFCELVPDWCVAAPTTPNKPGLVWAPDNGAGFPVGEAVGEDQLVFCELVPDWCVAAPAKKLIVWTADNGAGFPAGEVVAEDQLVFCQLVPEWCSEIDGPTQPKPDPERIVVTPSTQLYSVLRTGTGDLELISAGDWRLDSLYGVYTAGTQAAPLTVAGRDPHQIARGRQADGSLLGQPGAAYESATAQAYHTWYPELGGNLRIEAGGNLVGNLLAGKREPQGVRPQQATAAVGTWLWRQGQNEAGTPAAWGINFGTYAQRPGSDAVAPWLVGFTGIGTLGGGNLAVSVAGDAGLQQASNALESYVERSQGLNLVVASSGRIDASGRLRQTGGGDLDLRVGGGLNPGLAAVTAARTREDLGGVLVNLRGSTQVEAGSVGVVRPMFGSLGNQQDNSESRAYDPYTATRAPSLGGLTLMPGDSPMTLQARGDVVLQGVGDPGRIRQFNSQPFTGNDGVAYSANGDSWFSLWRPGTAIDLLSAGGNLVPILAQSNLGDSGDNLPVQGGRYFYPSVLRAVAANGSLYYGSSAIGAQSGPSSPYSLMLAPSPLTELQLLAGNSIYAGGYVISQSGTDSSALASAQRPAFLAREGGQVKASNLHGDLPRAAWSYPLFTYGVNTYASGSASPQAPARFYALGGDIVGLATGEILAFREDGLRLFQGAGPVRIMAGRDIVNAGVPLGSRRLAAAGVVDARFGGFNDVTSTGNLIIHGDARDVSLVSAGRDIRLSTFNVAGPGQLEVVAGRNLYQSGQGVASAYQEAAFNSIGRIGGADSGSDGASIAVIVGAGERGPDYARLLSRYLGAGQLADPALSLAAQPDKVAKVYDRELRTWLGERFAFSGDDEAARALFASLPDEQQRIFARQVYFSELREGGREYNNPGSARNGSYLRGRQVIAALFPEKDLAGNTIRYDGDATFYGGAGIHTDFGGAIQVLTPGGQQVFGVEGEAPPASAGVITQGSGDIQLYAQGSILLGQSRIMTTFGGSILGWSAGGDINAGRGSKTTVVYTPPKRTYDSWGNVGLAPSVPSTGAGIATLNPIAEVPPGDIDLIAPLGTIDAGEAGIRVSGNVNIAALQVVNAANIQVQGDAKGMPVVASVNTGAIASASAAASSASQAAEDVGRQQQAASRQRQPSVITVQVLGFGAERLVPGQDGASLNPQYRPQYNRQSPVQVLGAGALDERARAQLTEEERGNLLL